MKKYSVFYLTYFWTGILQFSSIEEILRNLDEIELPAHLWQCNDEDFQDQMIFEALTEIEDGPGNGATFIYQAEPNDFKNYLHIQKNY